MKKKIINVICIVLLTSLSISSIFAEGLHLVFVAGEDGKLYWYENGEKQGTYDDKGCVMGDGTCRGREIYDGASNGWYWLDSVYGGAKAEGKEVWIPYIYQEEDNWDDNTKRNIANESNEYTESDIRANMADQVYNAMMNKTGKWVRYDSKGKMAKGWYAVIGEEINAYPDQVGNVYYYDNKTGMMAKGETIINGKEYFFDEISGAQLTRWIGDNFYRPDGGKTNESEIANLALKYRGSGGVCSDVCMRFTKEALGIMSTPDLGQMFSNIFGIDVMERIDPSQARAGDTIAYYKKSTGVIRHVGVYLGNNSSLQGNYAGTTVIMNPYDVQLAIGAPKVVNDPDIEIQFYRPLIDFEIFREMGWNF